MDVVVDLLKLIVVVLVAIVTAWLRDLYAKRRRVDNYREHLFKERLALYRELWERYVKMTRVLGTKGVSVTAIGLGKAQQALQPTTISVTDKPSSSTDTKSSQEIQRILDEIDEFIAYARGTYVLLDPKTVHALDAAIQIIEGKTRGGSLTIDWGALHRQSRALQHAIRNELGIEELRHIDEITQGG